RFPSSSPDWLTSSPPPLPPFVCLPFRIIVNATTAQASPSSGSRVCPLISTIVVLPSQQAVDFGVFVKEKSEKKKEINGLKRHSSANPRPSHQKRQPLGFDIGKVENPS